LFQGDAFNPAGPFGVPGFTPFFGDGLLCAEGSVRRLFIKTAAQGQITFPAAGDPTIRARTATAGDPLPPGAKRVYQVWYRDVAPDFCVAAANFNTTNAVRVVW
jgi:hypothetical protein